MLTQNTEPHEKCSSSRPPVTGPIATPSPEKPAQTAIARPRSRGSRKTLARIDSVDGMISAPPMPMNARLRISCVVDRRHGRRHRADGEHDEADLQGALAAEAVAEAAGRQQQAGEHERVGVDDPLDLAVRRVEVLDHRRDRHVEDRVVERDDQQRDAQHGEDPPAPGVDLSIGRSPARVLPLVVASAIAPSSRSSGWPHFRNGTDQYRKALAGGTSGAIVTLVAAAAVDAGS